jgi:hypothetical protein
MTYALTIPDEKIPFFMELIKGFPFIKAEPTASIQGSNSLENNDLEIPTASTDEDAEKLQHVMKFVKPMRSFTVEDLVREQNYQGFDYQKFRELADKLDLSDEPIEELLECIK